MRRIRVRLGLRRCVRRIRVRLGLRVGSVDSQGKACVFRLIPIM
jgi:hypothetical protein